MKKTLLLLFSALAFSFCTHSQTSLVGSNLSGLTYYTPQIIFKDAFKQCSPWLTRNAASGGPWNTNTTIPMRSDGYPLQVPFGTTPQYVHTLLFLDAGGTHPSGSYTILSDGVGTIQLEWDSGNHSYTSPCNNVFNVNATNQGIHLTITSSDVSNPVRNIRVIMPGFLNNYLSDPYYPKFINYVDSADAFFGLRFMDLMQTNFSPVNTWSQRTTKDYYSQTNDNGIAYEYMIDICNRNDKDMWVCIPHQADDNFIQNFATLLRDSVETGRKIYVEYSNECWNGIFSQTQYCNAQGALLGYSGQPWEQGWKFFAKRTADCHRIFETVFGTNSPRLIKVVATQSGNSWLGNQIMTFYNSTTYNPTSVTADALAIAPYFAGGLADSIGNAGAISSITVQQIVGSMHASVYSQTQTAVAAYNTIANTHGVDLIAYEGGQHLVAVNNTYVNDTILTNKLIAANRHPFMQTIYCDMLDVWFNNGGKEFFNFSSIYKPNKYGSWGILEHSEQALASSYKWMAIHQCGKDSLSTGIDVTETNAEIQLFPNPTAGTFTIQLPENYSDVTSIEIYNTLGEMVFYSVENQKQITLNVEALSEGIYFVKTKNKEEINVTRFIKTK